MLDKILHEEPYLKLSIRTIYFQHQQKIHVFSRILCNALIQPHFDYVCSAWYPNLSVQLKTIYKLLKINLTAFA